MTDNFQQEHSPFKAGICNCLTKREWFAGMALQGMCANPDVTSPTYNGSRHDVIAYTAFQLADAMLAESQKDKPC